MENNYLVVLDHDRKRFDVVSISIVRTVNQRIEISLISGRNVQYYSSKVKSYQELVVKVSEETGYEFTRTLNY